MYPMFVDIPKSLYCMLYKQYIIVDSELSLISGYIKHKRFTFQLEHIIF